MADPNKLKVLKVLEPLIGDYVDAATINPETGEPRGVILVAEQGVLRTVVVGSSPEYVPAFTELVEAGTTDAHEQSGFGD